ncbi:hypothetical protein CDEST_15473 [Colletotrichum destructivum]|uniref:Uncharacterized protein n=1 Tax=Colletotrichum destructivum TaxID=34406 RepID=A0AAX4J4F7_9PEZI|nr:hypothetical protein CDEST_15473 [Colletotrichum destructivum]
MLVYVTKCQANSVAASNTRHIGLLPTTSGVLSTRLFNAKKRNRPRYMATMPVSLITLENQA